MPIFFSPLQRFYKFVLKRIIGRFLLNDFDLQQLEVELANGVITLTNFDLDPDVLNDSFLSSHLVIVSGRVAQLRATVPWRHLGRSHCILEIDGLEVVAVPACQVARIGPAVSKSMMASFREDIERSASELDNNELRDKIRLHKELKKQLHSSSSNDHEENSELADEKDQTGDAGIQLMASFIERLMSQTELVVSNFSVLLRYGVSADEATLTLHLPSLWYGDADKDAQDMSATDDSAPSFHYHKEIRFSGFRVDARLNDQQDDIRIADGDADRSCTIRAKISLAGAQRLPRVQLDVFVIFLRVVVIPAQVNAIARIATAIYSSAHNAALNSGLSRVESGYPTAMPISSDEIALLQGQLGGSRPSNNANVSMDESFLSDEFHECKSEFSLEDEPTLPSGNSSVPPTLAETVECLNSTSTLWTIRVHIRKCLVALMDGPDVPVDWWKDQECFGDGRANRLQTFATLQGLDHFVFCAYNFVLQLEQTSGSGRVELQVDECRMHEFQKAGDRSTILRFGSGDSASIDSIEIMSFQDRIRRAGSPDFRYQAHFGQSNGEISRVLFRKDEFVLGAVVLKSTISLFPRLRRMLSSLDLLTGVSNSSEQEHKDSERSCSIIVPSFEWRIRFSCGSEFLITLKDLSALTKFASPSHAQWELSFDSLDWSLVIGQTTIPVLLAPWQRSQASDSDEIRRKNLHASFASRYEDDAPFPLVPTADELSSVPFRQWEHSRVDVAHSLDHSAPTRCPNDFWLQCRQSASLHVSIDLPSIEFACEKHVYDQFLSLIGCLNRAIQGNTEVLHGTSALKVSLSLHITDVALWMTEDPIDARTYFICANDFMMLAASGIESHGISITCYEASASKTSLFEFETAIQKVCGQELENDHPGRMRPILLKTMDTVHDVLQPSSSCLSVFASIRLKIPTLQRDIMTVMNIRDMNWLFNPDTSWASRVIRFGSQSPQHCSPTSENHQRVHDVNKVFINLFDFVIDYNPQGCTERAVITVENSCVSSTVVQSSRVSAFIVDLQTSSVCVADRADDSSYVRYAPPKCWDFITKRKNRKSRYLHSMHELRKPKFGLLTNVNEHSITDHLRLHGFVNVVHLSSARIKTTGTTVGSCQETDHRQTDVSIGRLDILACADSLRALVNIVECFQSSIATHRPVPDVIVHLSTPAETLENALQATLLEGDWDEVEYTSAPADDVNKTMDRIRVIDDYATREHDITPQQSRTLPEESAKWLKDRETLDETAIFDDFFAAPLDAADPVKDLPDGIFNRRLVGSVIVVDRADVRIRLFAGNDFNRSSRSSAVPNAESSKCTPGDSAKFLLHKTVSQATETGSDRHSSHGLECFIVNAEVDEQTASSARESNGYCSQREENFAIPRTLTSTRDVNTLVEIAMDSLKLVHCSMRPGLQALKSRLVLTVDDLYVIDGVVTSDYGKLLCYLRTIPRDQDGRASAMMRLDLDAVLEDGSLSEEHRVRVRFLPLQLNLDQDTVDFLSSFAGSYAELKLSSLSASGQPPSSFFQRAQIDATLVNVSYAPKRCDLQRLYAGDYGQLAHVFPIHNMTVRLPTYRGSSLEGWDGFFGDAAACWSTYMSRNQAHRYVASVQPIRSLVNVGAGVADLVFVPWQEIRRHGHIGRGIRDGSISAARSVTTEAINLAVLLFGGASDVIESTTNSSALASARTNVQRAGRRTRRQPRSAKEGFRQAYAALSLGMQKAAASVVAIPRQEYLETRSMGGYVQSLVRGMPEAVLQPVLGVTQAVSYSLLGIRNSIDPIRQQQEDDKYKSTSRHSTTS